MGLYSLLINKNIDLVKGVVICFLHTNLLIALINNLVNMYILLHPSENLLLQITINSLILGLSKCDIFLNSLLLKYMYKLGKPFQLFGPSIYEKLHVSTTCAIRYIFHISYLVYVFTI
ncbi:hypothetical protein ACJX0J_026240 [Zea mays]